jgi:polar amino acid transport system substrate-binding protein
MRTSRILPVLLVPLVLTLGACGDDDDTTLENSPTSSPEGPSDPPTNLVDSGSLTVCSDTPYAPFEFQDDAGEDIGYDIDILREIAEDAELDLAVADLPFDGILGSLTAGECDVVASAVTITEERAEQVDFSAAYFDADQSLLVRAEDEATYATLASLTGQTIAVQDGTTGKQYAEEHTPDGATIKSYPDADALFAALISGEVAAVLQDFPVNAYRATQGTDFVVTERFATGEQYGFAVEKGNTEVLAFIDEGIAHLRDDGRFTEIFETYFGEE